jgi:hypothetical protein
MLRGVDAAPPADMAPSAGAIADTPGRDRRDGAPMNDVAALRLQAAWRGCRVRHAEAAAMTLDGCPGGGPLPPPLGPSTPEVRSTLRGAVAAPPADTAPSAGASADTPGRDQRDVAPANDVAALRLQAAWRGCRVRRAEVHGSPGGGPPPPPQGPCPLPSTPRALSPAVEAAAPPQGPPPSRRRRASPEVPDRRVRQRLTMCWLFW